MLGRYMEVLGVGFMASGVYFQDLELSNWGLKLRQVLVVLLMALSRVTTALSATSSDPPSI